MPFDWREYLELAKQLVGQASSGYFAEASERSAVSRAYFAAYCWVRNYSESKLGFQRTGSAEDHKYLRRYLVQHGKSRVASRLNRLRGWRNKCDYDDQVVNLNQYVKSAIEAADKVIEECR